ncbi:hypothetical protein [Maribacter hydrothermalis]|uniref:Lipoprotein n=1 Tax=Maribacter hydrothermalis TaxID=1836467 RepID=A0A1B7YXN2_9FLAO|nr:hypothetical protein [Maribacter hydrothermalis]APQ16823.1 hypothetical protein BTR34_05600 [Maribacter hydrothermalis]OBR35251.1 hypothetical protein A9200_11830 [Maribacter hydrothermalis]
MNKIITVLVLMVFTFSCKEKTTNNLEENIVQESKPATTMVNVSKFEDINGCSEHTILYTALPHLDNYKGTDFGELNCIATTEPNPFSIMLNAHYYGDDFSELDAFLFEVTEESANTELNMINLANTAYTTLSTFPGTNIFKSSLSQFNNPTITITAATETNNLTFATYTANYKEIYSIKISVKIPGTASLETIEDYLNEYLDAIHKPALL